MINVLQKAVDESLTSPHSRLKEARKGAEDTTKKSMIRAVEEGNIQTVEKLLDAGFAIEGSIQSHGNMTLLMYAASSAKHDVI